MYFLTPTNPNLELLLSTTYYIHTCIPDASYEPTSCCILTQSIPMHGSVCYGYCLTCSINTNQHATSAI